MTYTYLEAFSEALKKSYAGSLVSVGEAARINPRAKEYLHRLRLLGKVERVGWGWYYVPKKQDVWSFLAEDKGFKVLIKQTAASIWNYDFVHRNVIRLAVRDRSYKKALEDFGRRRGWIFEIEAHDEIPYEYKRLGKLFVESLESTIVSCISEWAFLDALATLYFRRNEIDFDKLKKLGRWKRISKSDVRVWTVIKYSCSLFNEKLGRKVFNISSSWSNGDLEELIDEAVEKVLEFA